MSERSVLVHVDLEGQTHFVGRLWARRIKNRESATFEYDKTWLGHADRFALEPALTLNPGPHHTPQGRLLFGAIGDSAPDRWGRTLLQREERRKARLENRQPRSLSEADYLLGIGDAARLGALRFKDAADGDFLAASDAAHVPPLVSLGELLAAATRMMEDGDDDHDDDVRLLLAPGSSLGGARAKASVLDRDRKLSIAKFPQPDDAYAVTLWEGLALDLAAKAGIATPTWRIETVGNRQVLILHRFDRDNEKRIPFLSAMSLLGAADNESHSYMEIADAIRQYGARPAEDCAELWRRIVFNVLVSNTDDHLRNHAFLYEKGGWRLAPAYDLNPVPVDIKPRVLSLAIDEEDGTASLDIALSVAKHFGLKASEAKEIAKEVGAAVAEWRKRAAAIGLGAKAIERMASAFEHEDLAQASS
jgi:serine/threonine-protein kinase HipA